jgi:hypothetical protein
VDRSIHLEAFTFGGGNPVETKDFKRKLTAVFSADVAGYSRLIMFYGV